MYDDTSIKIHRCFMYIVVRNYADFFIYPNNPFKINNAHVPVSFRHFSPLSVEIKQLLLYQSKRTYTCKTTCNHIDPSTGLIFVHDTRVLFRVDLIYQIKFYKIHVISMFKLSLIFLCDDDLWRSWSMVYSIYLCCSMWGPFASLFFFIAIWSSSKAHRLDKLTIVCSSNDNRCLVYRYM